MFAFWWISRQVACLDGRRRLQPGDAGLKSAIHFEVNMPWTLPDFDPIFALHESRIGAVRAWTFDGKLLVKVKDTDAACRDAVDAETSQSTDHVKLSL
jgi:hypothetical protein